MINLNILQFTKSYCLMLIMMSIVGVGSFSACNKKSKIDSNQPPNATEQFFTLKVTKTGTGSVSASWYSTMSSGKVTDAQIVQIPKGANVILTATPIVPMPYITWNNATTGNTYSVTMSKDQTIQVAFTANPSITHTLTLPTDGSMIAYIDEQCTQPLADLTKIAEGATIYLKVADQNKIINSITGIDDGSISIDKKTAIVTMVTDKTITATLNIDITGFRFVDDGSGGYTLTAYYGSSKNIEIPSIYNGKPVTSIGGNAFQYCIGLSSVTIPSNVANIGGMAFAGCRVLTDVTIQATTPPTMAQVYNMFDNTPPTFKIHVPSGYATAYQGATGWSYYSSKIIDY